MQIQTMKTVRHSRPTYHKSAHKILIMVRFFKFKVLHQAWNVLDLNEAESIHHLVIRSCNIPILGLMILSLYFHDLLLLFFFFGYVEIHCVYTTNIYQSNWDGSSVNMIIMNMTNAACISIFVVPNNVDVVCSILYKWKSISLVLC